MALGNQVCISVAALARRKEGTIVGTPKPGTIVQIKAATAAISGRFSYEPYDRTASGDRPQGPLYVLLEDDMQGKTRDDAYVTGTRCFVIAPLAGEEYNMLCLNLTGSGSGTQDAFAIGDLLTVNDGDGKLIKSASFGAKQIEPFVCMEAVPAIVADTHIYCEYTNY